MHQNPRFFSLATLSVLAPLLFGCGDDADFDYVPPTEAQLDEVQEIWNARDLAARGVTLLYRDDGRPTYQLRIYEHLVDGRRHYGAVTIPKTETPSAFPVVLFADGLNQANPRMDIRSWAQREQHLDQAVFVVPAFRGRTLVYEEKTSDADGDFYAERTMDAEGDFCDAYDGATDDAIALLNVAEAEIPQADFSRLMVKGASRGGTVALLLAERDERVTVAAAQSLPADFYRKEVSEHYRDQYRCQFLTGKTQEQARQRMLASSPLRFLLEPGVVTVYVDHGEEDTTAPIWNAREMVRQLETQPVDVRFHSYAGYGHSDLGKSPEFNAVQDDIYESFLAR